MVPRCPADAAKDPDEGLRRDTPLRQAGAAQHNNPPANTHSKPRAPTAIHAHAHHPRAHAAKRRASRSARLWRDRDFAICAVTLTLTPWSACSICSSLPLRPLGGQQAPRVRLTLVPASLPSTSRRHLAGAQALCDFAAGSDSLGIGSPSACPTPVLHISRRCRRARSFEICPWSAIPASSATTRMLIRAVRDRLDTRACGTSSASAAHERVTRHRRSAAEACRRIAPRVAREPAGLLTTRRGGPEIGQHDHAHRLAQQTLSGSGSLRRDAHRRLRTQHKPAHGTAASIPQAGAPAGGPHRTCLAMPVRISSRRQGPGTPTRRLHHTHPSERRLPIKENPGSTHSPPRTRSRHARPSEPPPLARGPRSARTSSSSAVTHSSQLSKRPVQRAPETRARDVISATVACA